MNNTPQRHTKDFIVLQIIESENGTLTWKSDTGETGIYYFDSDDYEEELKLVDPYTRLGTRPLDDLLTVVLLCNSDDIGPDIRFGHSTPRDLTVSVKLGSESAMLVVPKGKK